METAAGGVGKTSVCLTYFILFILVRERERVEREKGRDGIKVGEEEEGSAGGERE